jgi:N-methylhydantoinase B
VPGRWNAGNPSGGRLSCPPWGLRGGLPAETARTLVKLPGEAEFHKPAASRLETDAGAELVYQTAGGGGWGDPALRPVEKVASDVREGFISAEKARRDYRVVVAADGKLDAEATTRLRKAPEPAQ